MSDEEAYLPTVDSARAGRFPATLLQKEIKRG